MCSWGGEQECHRYMDTIYRRQNQYPVYIDEVYQKIAEEVNENGCASMGKFVNKDRLFSIRDEFENIKNRNELQYNDFYTEQVAHPLLTCKGVFDLAFDDKVIEIAKNYFGCLPTLNNAQLRKSKATNVKEGQIPGNGQTTLFHCDKDSPRFIKFFFYLNDVKENNGPFTYVRGSHLQKFEGWRRKYRWTQNEIEQIYGKERIVSYNANVGDLVLGNTSGFHKGMKVEEGERLLLTIYFSVHPTQWLSKWGAQMKKKDYDSLPEWKKPIADFINKV